MNPTSSGGDLPAHSRSASASGFVKYTFTVGFSHDISNYFIMERCIEPALEEFHGKHEDKQLRRPEAYLDASDGLGSTFLIRIFIPNGEARDLYVL